MLKINQNDSKFYSCKEKFNPYNPFLGCDKINLNENDMFICLETEKNGPICANVSHLDHERVNKFIETRIPVFNSITKKVEFIYNCKDHSLFTQISQQHHCNIFVGCGKKESKSLEKWIFNNDSPEKLIKSKDDIDFSLSKLRCKKCAVPNTYLVDGKCVTPMISDFVKMPKNEQERFFRDNGVTDKYFIINIYDDKEVEKSGYDLSLVKSIRIKSPGIPLLRPCKSFLYSFNNKSFQNEENSFDELSKTCICENQEGWVVSHEGNSCIKIGGKLNETVVSFFTTFNYHPEIYHRINVNVDPDIKALIEKTIGKIGIDEIWVADRWHQMISFQRSIRRYGYVNPVRIKVVLNKIAEITGFQTPSFGEFLPPLLIPYLISHSKVIHASEQIEKHLPACNTLEPISIKFASGTKDELLTGEKRICIATNKDGFAIMISNPVIASFQGGSGKFKYFALSLMYDISSKYPNMYTINPIYVNGGYSRNIIYQNEPPPIIKA